MDQMFNDPIERLVEHVVKRRYEELPPEVIECTKLSIIETVGTLFAGSEALGCLELRDQVREWGGRSEATILVHGGKVPIHQAALVNSTMARSLEFDNA